MVIIRAEIDIVDGIKMGLGKLRSWSIAHVSRSANLAVLML
jgi:hypothetical protein